MLTTLRSLSGWLLLLLCLFPALANAQQTGASLSGVITSSKGEQLPGVSVEVKTGSQRKGTASLSDGKYSIANLPAGVPLQITFSFIGFEPLVIKDKVLNNGGNTLSVQLKEGDQKLNELVVVGYGTQKKVNLTGAISQVGSEVLENRPVANVTQALQGAVPGLNITFTDGRPGANGRFNIRGTNPLSSGATPLVLIDGVPGSMNNVNPRDIETVTILKDAAASAIYGARAAFGVVLVTTKAAKKGKLTVNYGNNFSKSYSTVSTDYITDGYTSAMLNDEAFLVTTGNTYTRYTPADMEELKKRQTDKSLPTVVTDIRNGREQYIYYGHTDWWKEFFLPSQDGMEHSLSVSGGTEKVDFLISGRMYNKKGMMRYNRDEYNSFNLRTKLTVRANKWLTFTNNTQFMIGKYTYPGWNPNTNFVNTTVHALPSYVPKNPDGTATYITALNNYQIGDGLFSDLLYGKNKGTDRWNELMSTWGATIRVNDNINLYANYTFTLNPARDNDNPTSASFRQTSSPYSIYPGVISKVPRPDFLREETNQDYYHVANAYGEFQKSYGKHNVKFMAGYNQELKQFKRINTERGDLLSQDLNDISLGSGYFTTNGLQQEWALLGFFARVNYDYKGKYLFEANGRYDGTSRFPKGQRFGFFPSVSAGWRISEENFFEPLKNIVSDLKFRASYGQLGNQVTSSPYPYIPLLNRGTLDWIAGGKKLEYLTSPNAISPSLTWEKTASQNFGIDAGLFNNKLSLSLDYYIRDTKDMLTKGPTLPVVFGTGEPQENAADLRTKGFEINISYNDQFDLAGKPFIWSIGANLSDYRSVITRFDNPTNLLSTYYVGQKYGAMWGYMTDGYFNSDEEAAAWQAKVNQDLVGSNIKSASGQWNKLRAGDLKFQDLNGDGKISPGLNTLADHGDLVYLGNSQMRYPYAFNGSASWNGFDLSFFFQGIGKRNWYPGANADKFWGPYSRPYYSFLPTNFPDLVWTPEKGQDSYFPRLRGYIALNGNNPLTNVNDRYMQDLAYLRLKNLTIGYSLPDNMLKRLKLNRFRVYVSGDNLVTWTKLESKYIDPEQANAEANGRVYPFGKTFSAGLDLSF
ncbi:SusC/RagA family TonB-linked outer membrane protein [Chitinophaga sp. GCM10012297]|uniref:TonB-dependent receptor n=1 Tax=Chitinophaga chungangae TaxID=2821488 RepID=A0ABS3YGU6_9BACT|nr:TonB-dependent receptor [Chitinophaga chungangae]MBO9153901.1 TonB-dependent receptor [Chitinophaga chungangae]